jgi:hypothetical protein
MLEIFRVRIGAFFECESQQRSSFKNGSEFSGFGLVKPFKIYARTGNEGDEEGLKEVDGRVDGGFVSCHLNDIP